MLVILLLVEGLLFANNTNMRIKTERKNELDQFRD